MENAYEWIRSLWVVWLLLLFLGIVTYALWPSNKAKFEHAARIPLEDDDEPARDRGRQDDAARSRKAEEKD